jgi:AcrR family transcriptional regulator
MSKLSGAHDKVGLPRGRSSLSVAEAREAQRRRLVRASISAFAELGYADTTIADIVGRARVARQVFYELYESKEDCFLDAEAFGRVALLGEVLAPLAAPEAADSDAWIRGPIRAYLRTCVEEREFSRAWAVEFPNAGPRTLAMRNSFFEELAQLLRRGHEQVLQRAPACWQRVPELYYAAAMGGSFELVYRYISEARYAELPGLEDTIVGFVGTALGYRPPA